MPVDLDETGIATVVVGATVAAVVVAVAVVTVVAEAALAGTSTDLRSVQSTGSLWRTYQAAAAGRT